MRPGTPRGQARDLTDTASIKSGVEQRLDIRPQRQSQELLRLRRRHLVQQVHGLGGRVMDELVDEIVRHHPDIAADIDERLDAYARLTPELLRLTGGDRFPPWSPHLVGDDR